MDKEQLELVASNLTVAFYSAVEPLPAFLGTNRRKKDEAPEGLDMRNPSISPDDVFEVYERFVNMLSNDQ